MVFPDRDRTCRAAQHAAGGRLRVGSRGGEWRPCTFQAIVCSNGPGGGSAPTGRARTRALTDASCTAREGHHRVECEGGNALPPRGCALRFVPFKGFRAISSALLMARGFACERGSKISQEVVQRLEPKAPGAAMAHLALNRHCRPVGSMGWGVPGAPAAPVPRASCGSPARWNGCCGSRWGCGPRCTRPHPSGACGCPCRWRRCAGFAARRCRAPALAVCEPAHREGRWGALARAGRLLARGARAGA